MLPQVLLELFDRDLKRLKVEIESYTNEANLWLTSHEISNSGGNLCMHLVGNLKAFIGNGLADINYVRQREHEFAGKNIPREELVNEIDETIQVIAKAMDNESILDEAAMFPIKIWKHETGMTFTLIHLHSHLNYHLGQINYHRRLLDQNTANN